MWNRNSEAYAQAIIRLCNDDHLRDTYGRNARQRILDNFTTEKFYENVKKLIDEFKLFLELKRGLAKKRFDHGKKV